MTSIIQDPHENRCFLCGYIGNLDKHHVWHGTANRKIADEDGLFVYLCRECHLKLHDRGWNDKNLMKEGEKAWISYYRKGIPEFIERYGKNVL